VVAAAVHAVVFVAAISALHTFLNVEGFAGAKPACKWMRNQCSKLYKTIGYATIEDCKTFYCGTS
jgi:hypothetical protein